jgi:hypothetical protein
MRPLLTSILGCLLCVGATACGSASQSDSSTRENSSTTTSTRTGYATNGTAHVGSDSQSALPPQNEDYISTFGHEAPEPDRREIATLVQHYYAAGIAGDGAKACSMLPASVARVVPEEYGSPPGGSPELRGKTCATVLAKMFRHVPGQTPADIATTRIMGVRLLGNEAYVQLTSPSMPTGEMYVKREHGKWTIELLIGRSCKRCASH